MATKNESDDKSQHAIDLVIQCCSRIGCVDTRNRPDAFKYLAQVASTMRQAGATEVFPDRYGEHVAYAVDMVAAHCLTSPPAAISSVYLATRFEFYFRIVSGKLKGDGTWTSPEAQTDAMHGINDKRLDRDRISSVALAYRVMKLEQSLPIVQFCDKLDQVLYSTPTTVTGGAKVESIGDRIESGRHAVGHGHWGDISSEVLFYGLMTALVFYSVTGPLDG